MKITVKIAIALFGATASAFTTVPPTLFRINALSNYETVSASTKNSILQLRSFKVDKETRLDESKKLNTNPSNNVPILLDDDTTAITTTEEPVWQSLLWKSSIVVLCALWASNFATAKLIMAEPGVDSSLYTVSRFGVAALALLPGAIVRARKTLDFETLKGAAICGSWVAFGYIGQTLGLLTTTASKSCVICSLNCIFVAVIAELARVNSRVGKEFDFGKLVPALIAVAGVAIIELQGAEAPVIGDLLSFAQPIGFGLGYIQLENLMKKSPENALPVSAIKVCMVALASLGFFEFNSFMNQGIFQLPDISPILNSPTALGGVLYTGLITTALALWFESIAFKRVPATDVSIILSTEPLFAASAAALFLGETFGNSDYVGAAMIIGACLVAVFQEDEETEDYCDPDDMECEPKRNWPFVE